MVINLTVWHPMRERLRMSSLKKQQEWLESNHSENRAKGKKARPVTDVASTALRKEWQYASRA
jgi:hypothetical protein